MDEAKSEKYIPISNTDNVCQKLENYIFPEISLPNQNGNLLKLNRDDTFRLVIYFYSLTGHPNKRLPKNWEQIPGAQGCTLENSNFRDNYENFLELNSLPIGISTQNVDDIKEMTQRLKITHDILSDSNLECTRKLSLPTFSIENHVYLRRITLIVEKNMIKKAFFPVLSVHNHVNELLEWLRIN